MIVAADLSDDFIARLADFIAGHAPAGRDFSRLAVVFGGRRPALFLKKELATRINGAFFPPHFFSIDEFVDEVLMRTGPCAPLSDPDACYLIYQWMRKNAAQILKGRESFGAFLPWAKEILAFFEQLDLEGLGRRALEDMKLHAELGYDVPETINALLGTLVRVREEFHRTMSEGKKYTRGFRYLQASRAAAEAEFGDFDRILFCNFFYLHKTERALIKAVCDKKQGVLFLQGSQEEWPVFGDLSAEFGAPISPASGRRPAYVFSLHPSFDVNSQVCCVREVLKSIKNHGKTVVVLPDPETLIPLLSEISCVTEELNVSMGYPLKRSPLHAAFLNVFRAQETKKEGQYYARDYLRTLNHPLAKNLDFGWGPQVTRILIHKIEEALLGVEATALGGTLFVRLSDVEEERDIVEIVMASLKGQDAAIGPDALKETVVALHKFFFRLWEDVATLHECAACLEKFLDFLLQRSPLVKYPLNLKIAEQIYALGEEFRTVSFSHEKFYPDEVFRIFGDALETKKVSFSGSPLRGLQILGLFETRALSFENVLILDVNESVLPKLKVYEPLIPRDVLTALGLSRLEKEEEIQRYQFFRLLASARNVHLFYREGAEKVRSRFIEELIWQKEQEERALMRTPLVQPGFRVRVAAEDIFVRKREAHIAYLKNFCHSASSLDTYLSCPLRFYYRYILLLRERATWEEDPEARDIGNFVHGLLEETFSAFLGKRPAVDAAFRKYFFERFKRRFDEELARKMKSDSFLLQEVLEFRLNHFLDFEAEREVDELAAVELRLGGEMLVAGAPVVFQCKVDRIDRLADNTLFIIDYKTGAGRIPADAGRIEERGFERPHLKETLRSFQLPLYLHFVRQHFGPGPANAALYNLKEAGKDACLKRLFKTQEEAAHPERLLDVFQRALHAVLAEMMDTRVPFRADPQDVHYCGSCPFFYLCRGSET